MTYWLNHVTVLTAAASSHTLDPSNPTASGGVVKDGTAFTPTAGRFLVCVVAGPVTSSTPSGWTLSASSVNTGGLYTFTKAAAGSDTLSTTHNSAAYQVTFDFYEFSSATTFVAWTGGSTLSGSTRTLSGLTGDNLVMTSVDSPNAAGTFSFTGATPILDYDTGGGGAHHYAIAYTVSSASSVGVAATLATHEQVMVALTGMFVTGSFAATLPALTASFTGTVSGPSAGTIAATLPKLAGSFSGSYLPPPISGSFAATLPSLSASFAAFPFGSFAAALPLMAASYVGDYSGPIPTDTSNAMNGLDLVMVGTTTQTRPVVAPPTTVVLAKKYDKAIAYPTPTMVNGRPT